MPCYVDAYIESWFKCLKQELNLAVCGSQIVGLVPQDAIELSAAYYMEKDNLFLLEEDQKIRLVSFNCHRVFVV